LHDLYWRKAVRKYSYILVPVLAISASAPVLADDNDNSSAIEQIGTGMTASALQEGTLNTSEATIEQGALSAGDNLSASILQEGTSNTQDALIQQDDADSEAVITQTGVDTLNQASVAQNGINNYASISQDGMGAENSAAISQTGTGLLNSATISQSGTGTNFGASIVQNGENLVSTITQN
jgi:hypothetical protein